MRNAGLGLAVFCSLLATSGCGTPSSDWNGTWKLNPLKSNFQGPVFTISNSADGEYGWDDGYSSLSFRCDGKDRPIGQNRTQACVKNSATALEITRKENGITTGSNRWELSANGDVFTATATAFRPSGSVITSRLVASRISGSNGFAGRWRDSSYLQRHSDMTLSIDSQALHIVYPGAGQDMDAPLNGAGATMHGPHPQGVTYAVRLAGRRKFLILMQRNGKVLNEESLELSNHGRIVTDSWWNPDRPDDKGALVYEKK